MSIFFNFQSACNSVSCASGTDHSDFDRSNELHTAIATEVARREIAGWLWSHHVDATAVSGAFVAGSALRYDLLLVRRDARPALGLIYSPSDVLAVILVREEGVIRPGESADELTAINRALELSPRIRWGHLTMSSGMDFQAQADKLQYAASRPGIVFSLVLTKEGELFDTGEEDSELDHFLDFLLAAA